MTNQKISTKKLKAIVFTDIVDFTKMSAEDEQHALDIIHMQRELLKPIVVEHKGEWLKEIGDGLLFSFDSSLDAVRCSIKIQEALRDIDDFKLRIGIHQGDIFIQDGDVYGDDVNIASRVEGFSPEGGISISDKVYKDIQGVKDIKTSFIGHKPLKGVSQETKVRCITSNSLPDDKGNRLPKFIGFTNIYFGILLLIIFSLASFSFIVDSWNINTGGMHEDAILPMLLNFLNLGLALILFGYSTISFYKGVSIKSQKNIYYIGIIYILVLLLFFWNNLKIVTIDDYSSPFINNITGWFWTIALYLFPLIVFKSIQAIYKKVFKK
jgi:class 3 adenylate cyclase|tara:strand:- start:49 stop:1020 length:972 start_codon:yes stop_codon:yes gene_type:complete